MVNADTPAPEKEEIKTAIPPEADTPAEKKPEGDTTPPAPQKEQKVVELEAQVEELKNLLTKQETIAKGSQRDKAVAERKKRDVEEMITKIKSGEIDISEINLPAEALPSGEEGLKKDVHIGIQDLLLGNSDYQDLLSKDITLREVIKKNPLVLIGEFYSVEDAVEQIREKLDERVSSLKTIQPKEEKKEGEGKEFEPGPIQTKEAAPTPPQTTTPETPDEKLEESIKNKIKVA